jgi:hypothetical protein
MKRSLLLLSVIFVGIISVFGFQGCHRPTSEGYYRDRDDRYGRGFEDREGYYRSRDKGNENNYEGNTINRPWYNEGDID